MALSLAGLAVCVDVQHAYRKGNHEADRGSVYTLDGGRTITEWACSLHYAQALIAFLTSAGARVITNNPAAATLIGPYSARQRYAAAQGAKVYLACHLNAGGGTYTACEFALGNSGKRLGDCITAEMAGTFPEVTSARTVPLPQHERGWVCVAGFNAGPAVIIEPLFGDSRKHWPLLTNPGLEAVGEAIGRGVANWWGLTHPAPRVMP